MSLLQKKSAKYNVSQSAKENGLYSYYYSFESGQDTEVIVNGEKTLMFGSNSYPGLINYPEIIKAAKKTLNKYGTGASGSRLMSGNIDLHNELENNLADFVSKPATTIFSTGFQVNMGTIPSLVGRNNLIVIDDKSHASIVEGCRLAFAKNLKYKHNNMESLEKILQKTDKTQTTLIVTDGIFSMEGDIAHLDKICKLADKYSASVMVDDAHALGVIGKNGSGMASHYNITKNPI